MPPGWRPLITTPHDVIFRQAALKDADTVAEVAQTSRLHFLPYLPELHTVEEVKAYYRAVVFAECHVWVAEDAQGIVGFCAFQDGWVEHLYLLPTHVGKTLGRRLLDKAKAHQQTLRLWVFHQNIRAIRFYEQNGFRKIKETDGSANEEHCPDALLEWRRPP